MPSPWATHTTDTDEDQIDNDPIYLAYASGPTPQMLAFEDSVIQSAIDPNMPYAHIAYSLVRLLESLSMTAKCSPERYRLLLSCAADVYAEKYPIIMKRMAEYHAKNQANQPSRSQEENTP